jgi:hypothetical protein
MEDVWDKSEQIEHKSAAIKKKKEDFRGGEIILKRSANITNFNSSEFRREV